MIVRTSHQRTSQRIWAVTDGILDALNHNTFTPATSGTSGTSVTSVMDAIVNLLWPAAEGWESLLVETLVGYRLYAFTHPIEGVGVSLIHVSAPTSDFPTSDEEARSARRDLVNDLILTSYHAHGLTRIDLLDAINATTGPVDTFRRFRPNDRHHLDLVATANLLRAAEFLDDTTQMMIALGACCDLLAEAGVVVPV